MSTTEPAAPPGPPRPRARPRRDALACAALTLAWLAAACVIGVGGDFPLNDDWAYAHSAQVLCESGRLERVGWTWAPIVTHAFVGALACELLGFSFESLRLSSLLLGWLGVLASYGLFRQLSVSPGPSLLAAASVAFNPLYLNLSFTYMTDVPFATLATASTLAWVRGLARRRPGWLLAGLALAGAALVSRQVGIALPLAFAGSLAVARGERLSRGWIAAAALALAAAVWVVGSGSFFTAGDAAGDYPLHRFLADMLGRPGFARETLRNALVAVVYLGLFLAPVAAVRVSLRGRAPLAAAALALAALGGLALAGRRMPLGGNVLYDFGVGPATLSGAYDAVGRAPGWVWWGLTALGVLGAAWTLALVGRAVWRRPRRFRRDPVLVLLLVLPVLLLLPQVASNNFFDRYLLTPLPPLLALLLAVPGPGRRPGRAASALAGLLLVGLVAWSVLGTRDYLEHHRTRWELVALLVERGAPPERIEAGFEYVGWLTRDDDAVGRYLRRRGRHEAEFVIAHDARLPRYRPLASRSFERWLVPGRERLTAHRRLARARDEGS